MKQRLLIAFSTLLLLLLPAACTRPSADTTYNSMPGSTTKTSSMTVPVKETDFTIAAAITRFVPGTTYHFIITNTGKIVHEFMIMPRSEGNVTKGMSMGEMDTMALASISDLNPGETKTLDYTFPFSATIPHPEFACYLPGHYEAGMKQDITVTS